MSKVWKRDHSPIDSGYCLCLLFTPTALATNAMKVPSASSNGKPPALRFCVIGSFPGDDDRLAAALRLHDRLLQGAVSAAVTTSQVREVLSSLPMNGRVEFCVKSLLSADMPAAVQEQNSKLILQLFQECFAAVESSSTVPEVTESAEQANAAEQSFSRPDVDDWVIVSLCTGPAADSVGEELSSPGDVVASTPQPNALLYLKGEGYYVLRALLAALQSFGSVSVALFDEYFSHTTSTVFRRQFIKAMVALPTSLFSDERLERVYHSSVEAVRRAIESECKQHNGLRADFLSRLIISGATSSTNELIHHATSELLEEHLLRSVVTASEPALNGRVLSIVNQEWICKANWTLHADVYLRFLSDQLEAHRSDLLWCGCFLNDFYSLLLAGGVVSALSSAVAVQLFDMYTTFRPLTIQATVPAPVKQLLFELSKQGKLGGSDNRASTKDVAYAGVSRVLPPSLVLCAMSSDEKWKALNSMLVRTPHGMAFSMPQQELCETLFRGFANKSRHHHDVSVLARQVIAALSPFDFRRLVFDTAGQNQSQTARTCRIILDTALAIKSTRFSQPVLQAWLEMHLDNTPNNLEERASSSSEEKLWGVWCNSIREVIQPRLTVIASKAILALSTNSVRATRSQITSYVGYAALLSEQLLLVLQRCAHAISPQQLLQTALGALDLLGPLVTGSSLAPLYTPTNEQHLQQHSGERSIAAVRFVGNSFALLAVSSIQRGLDFDVSSPQYAQLPAHFLRWQLSQLSTATNLELFPALGPALLTLYEHLLHASQLSAEVQQRGFIMVAPRRDQRPSGVVGDGEKATQITWVYVNSAHHLQCAAVVMEHLEQLCVQARAIPALEKTAQKAWKLVRPRYFPESLSAAESLQKVDEFEKFLDACSKLPSSVAEDEKPLLLSALVHHLKANTFRSIGMGSGLTGWWTFLLSAIDACGAEWPSRTSWLLQFQDVSLAPVRECLQQGAQDREPQNRQLAFLNLLSVSLGTSWREFARSVEYVQRRTKNEAGLYRRDIYQRIASSIPAVVAHTLDTVGALSAASTEEETLAGVQVITDSLIQILRDDLSKRDSVAKGIFHGVAQTLITVAISHVSPPLLSIRRAWITCGRALDLLLIHAASGEGAGHNYVWPITGTVFSREQWLTEDELFGAVHKAVINGFRGGEHVFATLSQQVYRTKQHVHVAPTALYTPEQAVELLCSTLTAQTVESPPRAADHLIDGAFFPAGDATTVVQSMGVATCESGTLRCMQQLFRFCGARWTSVPRLVHFFEQVVSTVADTSRAGHPLFASHYRQTYSLFHTVRQLYAGAAWYELLPLSRACTALFALAIRMGEVTDAQVLCPLWTEMRMHQGKVHTFSELSLSHISFLVINIVPMRGRQAVPVLTGSTNTECLKADISDTHERAATRLRDLLAMSPSALHLVWQDLISSRDDIFGLYLGRTLGELAGVFQSSPASLPAKATPAMAYFPATSAQLVLLNADAMQTFTHMCMQRAMDRSLSANERSQAITQFVQSPAASHQDVIAVLRKLQTAIASRNQKDKEAKTGLASTREAVVDDDAADLLLESVILRVFDTDATWFVLAFLLDPKTIASAPQRTTATIVTNLRLWAPVDRAVAVLRVLLEPGRRWAIGHFLHKQILRLLFECSDHHALARELFVSEWRQHGTNMPKDVCHEVVKLAVSAFNDRSEMKQALAWSIVDDLITDARLNNIDPATIVLLFTPTWQPDMGAIRLSTVLRDTNPPRRRTIGGVEASDSFSHVHSLLTTEPVSAFSTSTRQMCERLAALMNKLSVVSQNRHVRVLSQLQQFVFSSNMAGEADDETMERLRQLLLQSTVEAAVMAETPLKALTGVVLDTTSEWELNVISRLYAGLSIQVLARALVTNFVLTPADANLCTHLCQHHPYAIRLKESVGTLLWSMLSTPPAQAERRFRLAKALMGIMDQVNQTSLPTLPSKVTKSTTWLSELIQAPFSDLLDSVRRDSLQCANLVQSVGQ